MRISMVVLAIEFLYCIFCIIYFGCGLGDCENNLICCIHYIKFFQTMYLMNTYNSNIKERQPNHPIGTLNTFLVVLLYYVCLYPNIGILNEEEPNDLVHYCGAYPALDLFLILMSFCFISKVKGRSRDLIENRRFTEYNTEAEIALGEILYLP